MARRTASLLAVFSLVVGLLLGGAVTALAAPADPCDKLFTSKSVSKLKAYTACREDRQDAALKRIEAQLNALSSQGASPSASASPTSGASGGGSPRPSASPTPTTSPNPSSTPGSGTGTSTGSSRFPDATTTGVDSGTRLKRVPQDVTSGPGWHYDSRGWVSVDTKGAVFSGYRVGVNVDVTADDVTVSNNIIELSANDWGISLRHTRRARIERNTIHGGTTTSTICDNAIRDIYGDSDDVNISYNNIFACSSGINHLNRGGLIQKNYIHDLGAECSGGDRSCGHYNGIQLGAGAGPLMTIDNNTILLSLGYTDAIMLANDDGDQTNRKITNNLLGGGAYTFYGSGHAAGVATGIEFSGNRFTTRAFPRSGQYGPVVYWQALGAGNVWQNNTWADGPNAGEQVKP